MQQGTLMAMRGLDLLATLQFALLVRRAPRRAWMMKPPHRCYQSAASLLHWRCPVCTGTASSSGPQL